MKPSLIELKEVDESTMVVGDFIFQKWADSVGRKSLRA